MIHYNVWFRFRGNVEETEGWPSFMRSLANFALLVTSSGSNYSEHGVLPPRPRCFRSKALIEFRDDAQFSAAFFCHRQPAAFTQVYMGRGYVLGQRFPNRSIQDNSSPPSRARHGTGPPPFPHRAAIAPVELGVVDMGDRAMSSSSKDRPLEAGRGRRTEEDGAGVLFDLFGTVVVPFSKHRHSTL